MSVAGIGLVADVFSLMQETRGELLRMASDPKFLKGRPVDTQNIRLAQLLETGKEAMKEQFQRIALEMDIAEEAINRLR